MYTWNYSFYLVVSLGEWIGQVITLLIVPSHGQKCQHVTAACKYTDWSSANILTIMLFTLHCIQMYNYTAPSLDICFVVTAILERNALHCSTSSPRVEPAPSWCAPLHFTWTERIQNLNINCIHNSTFRKTQWCHLIKRNKVQNGLPTSTGS